MQIELCFEIQYGIISIYAWTEPIFSSKVPTLKEAFEPSRAGETRYPTPKETDPMIQDFQAKLKEYAHLLVEVGLNAVS